MRTFAARQLASVGLASPMRWTPVCDRLADGGAKMTNWLVRLWHRIEAWLHRREPVSPGFHRSNLHGRSR